MSDKPTNQPQRRAHAADKLEPEDSSGAQLRQNQVPAEPSRPNTVMRVQTWTGGYVARHPAMFKVLESLGWNNPGGGMNP